ncbi:MAG: RecX family transcriptional regulator [Fimbriimonadaceae bacterium]
MEELNSALTLVLGALKRKDLFESEIRALLERHELGEHAEPVMKELHAKLDWTDEKVAQRFVERSKGKGSERLAVQLHSRGYSGDIESPNERERAQEALKKKFDEKVDAAKAWRFLRSRGFSEEICEEVVPAND